MGAWLGSFGCKKRCLRRDYRAFQLARATTDCLNKMRSIGQGRLVYVECNLGILTRMTASP